MELRTNADISHRYYREGDEKPEGFVVEIADAVIRLLDLSAGLGIDIDAHVCYKLEYNATRPYKHGKKY